MWGVGEGAAKEHGGGAALDERDVAAEVEGDRGAECLIAEEEDFVFAGDVAVSFEALDGVGEVF